MAEDVMLQPWVCIDCRAHLNFGQLKTCKQCTFLHCPICGSANTAPADGQIRYFPGPYIADKSIRIH